MAVSYKPMVRVGGHKEWVANALRFATREEALVNVNDLMMRWTSVDETTVEESDDPANYRYDLDKRKLIPLE
jgi:hypothetical protein